MRSKGGSCIYTPIMIVFKNSVVAKVTIMRYGHRVPETLHGDADKKRSLCSTVQRGLSLLAADNTMEPRLNCRTAS